MKKIILLLFVLPVLVLVSCKGDTGVAGPAGAPGYVMIFQQAIAPTSAYTGAVSAGGFSSGPYENAAGASAAYCGVQSGYTYRAYLKFDISGLPSTAVIKRAELTLSSSSSGAGDGAQITAHAITSSWSAGGCSWVSRTASTEWGILGGDMSAAPVSDAAFLADGGEKVTLSIGVSTVDSWKTAPLTNNGLLIKSADEAADGLLLLVYGASSSYGDSKPKLSIYYTLP